MKRPIKVLLGTAALLLTAALTVQAVTSPATDITPAASSGSAATQTVSADGVTVSFAAESGFTVTDPYGQTWQSNIDPTMYDYEDLNESWQKNINSILTIQYADISDINPAVRTQYSPDAKLSTSVKGGSLEVTLTYPSSISLTVVATPKDGGVTFSVPADRIKEGKKNKLVAAELLPYFGACLESEEGYTLYPDGAGAIKLHNSTASANVRNHSYSWNVYGVDISNLSVLEESRTAEQRTAMLPVFGIKKGEQGLLAYSLVGEAESVINMTPAGASIDVNRTAFSFVYRTWYTVAMSNIDINGNSSGKDINGKMYNADLLANDHEVSYSFLTGEEAGYSGMASRFREILLDAGLLNRSEQSAPMAVDLFMGSVQQNMFQTNLVTVTTVDQAQTVMDDLRAAGMTDAAYTLVGWSQGGYGVYPQPIEPDRAYGNRASLLSLLEKNPSVSLRYDSLNAHKDGTGFSGREDVIKSGNQNTLTNADESRFLLNLRAVTARLGSLETLFSGIGRQNLSLSEIGRLIYRDSAQAAPFDRETMKRTVTDLLKTLSAKGTLSVDGANLYTLAYADAVFSLEETSSEYFISDQTVPFVQMVLHGSLPYTGNAGNLAADFETCLLKWIEYGYTPYFELTYDNADKLKYTEHNDLFTSQYNSHLENMKRAYTLFADELSPLTDAYMLRHEVLSEDLRRVTYSGGYQVYINYGGEPAEVDGLTVPAKGYCVKEVAE